MGDLTQLPAEVAEELTSGFGYTAAQFVVAEDEHIEDRRWSALRRVVIQDASDDSFYEFYYNSYLGDTEGDTFDDDPVRLTQVFPVQETITKYVSAEKVS